jgi:hypothetical protein
MALVLVLRVDFLPPLCNVAEEKNNTIDRNGQADIAEVTTWGHSPITLGRGRAFLSGTFPVVKIRVGWRFLE